VRIIYVRAPYVTKTIKLLLFSKYNGGAGRFHLIKKAYLRKIRDLLEMIER
jgi:hypothetical protein